MAVDCQLSGVSTWRVIRNPQKTWKPSALLKAYFDGGSKRKGSPIHRHNSADANVQLHSSLPPVLHLTSDFLPLDAKFVPNLSSTQEAKLKKHGSEFGAVREIAPRRRLLQSGL